MLTLDGRRVLVTGATGALGTSIAMLVAELGGKCVLHGRDSNKLAETLPKLPGIGHIAYQGHLDESGDYQRLIDFAVDGLGGVDSVIHAMGIHVLSPLKSLTASEIGKVFSVNVYSAFYLAQAFRRKSVPKKDGSIVFLSSVTGTYGQPGISAYAASKGAINALTKSLAVELAAEAIRVNAIASGAVNSGMTLALQESFKGIFDDELSEKHLLGLGSSEDVAWMAAFLVSGRSRWITGSIMPVDGGYTAQ